MKIKEIMTPNVEVVRPEDSLQNAARKMRDRDIGFLPVLEGDQLVGVVTDRDLVMRCIAEGMNSEAVLGRGIATSPAIYCYSDEDVEDAAQLMNRHRIRRLVILNRNDNRLAGVISLGDLAGVGDESLVGHILVGVSVPS